MTAGLPCVLRALILTLPLTAVTLAEPAQQHPTQQHPELQPSGVFSAHVNGVRLPVMGWNPWNAYQTEVDEQKIMAVAQRLVSSGLAAKGYRYVDIDDGWWLSRASDGRLRIRTRMFPSAALADGETSFRPWVERLHAMGLKAGIYTDIGRNTCSQRWNPESPNLPQGSRAERETGSYQFQQQDVRTFVQSWGFDLVKVDACGLADFGPDERAVRDGSYRSLGPLIVRSDPVKTDRPGVEALYASLSEQMREARPSEDYALALCTWGEASVRQWGNRYGTSWRTSADLEPTWKSMVANFDSAAAWTLFAGPGHWNDADMMGIGLGEFGADNLVKARAHLSLWVMLSSPLILGNRLAEAPDSLIELVGNPEVIAVDQDPAGHPGSIVLQRGDTEVMMKTLAAPGAKAVALINRGAQRQRIEVPLSRLGFVGERAKVRDLWARRNLPSAHGELSFTLAPYETRLLRIVGRSSLGDGAYLGELPARIYIAEDGTRHLNKGVLPATWVPARVDYAPSGAPLDVNGTLHDHGIGILANSRIEFDARQEFRQLQFLPAVLSGSGERVVFRVYGDGKPLWEGSGNKPEPVEIPIVGVRVVELVAESPDSAGGALPPTIGWVEAAAIR